MRGKRVPRCRLHQPCRFIPAHAGKTLSPCVPPPDMSVHPRACGENVPFPAGCGRLVGSSPRMRGKRGAPSSASGARRFIPAHAGKTNRTRRSSTARSGSSPRMRGKPPRGPSPHRAPTVHPRACGENTAPSLGRWCGSGSSPRMRGKHFQQRVYREKPRFIPAHAGKTRFPRPGRWWG